MAARKVSLRSLWASVLALTLAVAGLVLQPGQAQAQPTAPALAEISPTSTFITEQANWVLQAQLPDGAIAVWPDRPTLRLIWPYLGNLAAAGLARASEVTGNPLYAQRAWAYLYWYASVEQPGSGYVTDYTVQDGTTPVPNGNIDSTDAYAGTFLAAAWDTYYATSDLNELKGLAAGAAGALHAIESTQQPNGLTWAKPTWQVAYLMDNAQALGGLEAAASIESTLGNTALAAKASGDAAAMRQGIADLWDPATGAYDWAEQANGARHTTDWPVLYPDTMEQVFAVLWGAVTGERATSLMEKALTYHPDWDQPAALDDFLHNATVQKQPVGYWPCMSSALAETGDPSAAEDGLSLIMQAASTVAWGWPYTTADAGDAIIAASGLPYLSPTVSSETAPTSTTTTAPVTTTTAPSTTTTTTVPSTTSTVPATTTTVPATTTTTAPVTTTSAPSTTTTTTVPSTTTTTTVPSTTSTVPATTTTVPATTTTTAPVTTTSAPDVASTPPTAASSPLRAAPALLVKAVKQASSSSGRLITPPNAQSAASGAYAHNRSGQVAEYRRVPGPVQPSRPGAGRPVAITTATSVGPRPGRPAHQPRHGLAARAGAQRGGGQPGGPAKVLVAGLALLSCLGVLATLALALLKRRA
ncbi:MAG: hypothetical protein ACP5VR_09900 [Acidimicrobiales bacterium]